MVGWNQITILTQEKSKVIRAVKILCMRRSRCYRSIIGANSGKERGSPGTLLGPGGSREGAGQMQSTAPGWLVNIAAEQTQINLWQEKPVTKDGRVWKREKEKFTLGAGGWWR